MRFGVSVRWASSHSGDTLRYGCIAVPLLDGLFLLGYSECLDLKENWERLMLVGERRWSWARVAVVVRWRSGNMRNKVGNALNWMDWSGCGCHTESRWGSSGARRANRCLVGVGEEER